jgi:hypothetical protein
VLQQSSEDELASHHRSSDSGSSSSSTSGLLIGTRTAAAAAGASSAHKAVQQQHQQQYTLELAMLAVAVHRPDAVAVATAPKSYSQAVKSSSSSPHLQELVKLPALQGVVTVTCPPPAANAAAAAGSSSHGTGTKAPQQQQQQQWPLVKVGLQLPPISCTISASLVAALQQFAAALKFQLQLPLADLVACYHLNASQQPAAAAAAASTRRQQRSLAAAQQQQEGSAIAQLPTNSTPSADTAAAAAAAAAEAVDLMAVAAAAGIISRQDSAPPSPTDSEVARWMAAPAALQPAAAAEDASHFVFDDAQDLDHLWTMYSTGTSSGNSGTGATQQQQQQLKRCDSDRLLQSMSLSPPTMLDLPVWQQQQQQQAGCGSSSHQQRPRQQQRHAGRSSSSAAAAAAALALPELQLLAVELLLEELDIQYIQDLPLCQQQQQQTNSSSSSSPELHLRLQASLLQVQFRHCTQGSTADVSLNDLVLQDVLPAPAAAAAAAAGAPDWRRLLSHLLLDRLQVAWGRQLQLSGVQQEVQVALVGLQLQVSMTTLVSFWTKASVASRARSDTRLLPAPQQQQ